MKGLVEGYRTRADYLQIGLREVLVTGNGGAEQSVSEGAGDMFSAY